MTDAYFAAAIAVHSAFANQRRDYAEKNRIDNDTLKALSIRYGAAMIGYYSDESQSDEAWLARNSWGSFAGSDDGYEWISYEQLIGDGTVCIVGEGSENLHVNEHDPLGGCNSFVVNQPDIWAANVFRTDSDNKTLESVSFYTTRHKNTRVRVKVYNLGADFGGSNPAAGNLICSVEEMMDYAGYHTLKTDRVSLTSGNYFSVVVQSSRRQMMVRMRLLL